MYKDKKAKERLELGERLTIGLKVLELNQGAIQFADSKANGLVLVNSIFILAVVPAIESFHRLGRGSHEAAATLASELPGGAHPLLLLALGAFFVGAVAALFASLRVTLSRRGPDEPRQRSIVFFEHVAAFHGGGSYVDEVREIDGERVLEAVLLSSYDASSIANAKFSAVKLAEKLTVLAAVLWAAAMTAQVMLG